MARPRKYKNVKELKKAIDAYFALCGKDELPLTITGLAMACDFESRQALINYEGYSKEYHDTIKKAKLIVQNYAEMYLFVGKNVVGAIFNLKCNYGWQDTQEIKHSGSINLSGIFKQIDNGTDPKAD